MAQRYWNLSSSLRVTFYRHFDFFNEESLLNVRLLVRKYLELDISREDLMFDIGYYEWEASKVRDQRLNSKQR